MEIHLRTTWCRLPRHTQCYLPPDTSKHTHLNPSRWRLVLRGMEGWVDLGGWLHTEMVYPSTDGHPSKY